LRLAKISFSQASSAAEMWIAVTATDIAFWFCSSAFDLGKSPAELLAGLLTLIPSHS